MDRTWATRLVHQYKFLRHCLGTVTGSFSFLSKMIGLGMSSIKRVIKVRQLRQLRSSEVQGCMRTSEGWSHNYTHTQTKPSRRIFSFGAFQPTELVLENSFKIIFLNFQTIIFWKAETKRKQDLLEFLRSEII